MSSSQFSPLFLILAGCTRKSPFLDGSQLSFNLERVHFQAHSANEIALRSNFH